MSDSILKYKSYAFAIDVVKVVRNLQNIHKEHVLTKQLLRSGTAVGAMVSEAEFGQSKADFIHKMTIALKEANESRYWLRLLSDTGYLNQQAFEALSMDCTALIKILVSTIKTSKQNSQ